MSAKPPTPRFRRALALGTATAFGLGGLFATPAFAETSPSDAPVSGKSFETNSLALLAEDGVEAVGRDADGNVVIVVSEDSAEADDFEATYGNVVVEKIPGGFDALAATDVVGGAGYAAPVGETGQAGLCSVGFSAWDPNGAPAIVTAGHCTNDGTLGATFLTTPSDDTAGGGTQPSLLSPLGTFGFSQFGGPGNTEGVKNSTSVDIAVIDDINPALDLLPEVTDWTNTTDLSASTTEISSVGTVDLRKPVTKSGRTTGLSTSTGSLTQGWADVAGRTVKGFGGDMRVDQGDSGGAVFQGEKAVGIVSGGNDPGTFIWVADLQAGLGRTGGYTIQLAIDAPVLTSPAEGGDVERGAAISGTGPANTTIVVTPEAGQPFETTTNAAGAWSFDAPTTLGDYSFAVQAKNGFNLSETNTYTVQVVPAPLRAPSITTPADGSTVETSLTEVSGRGTPGATVTVTGDVTGTSVVSPGGSWSVPAELSYGSYSISATQSVETETSPAMTSDFVVAPVAPSISTPGDGDWFYDVDAPASASGVGIEGATVTLDVNGETVGTYDIAAGAPIDGAADLVAAAAPGDNWEIGLANALVTGSNTISATQTIDGITSAAETVTIDVRASAAPAQPGTPGDAPGDSPDNGDDLAVTGADVDLLPVGIAAWLLIAGGLSIALVRKRRLATQD